MPIGFPRARVDKREKMERKKVPVRGFEPPTLRWLIRTLKLTRFVQDYESDALTRLSYTGIFSFWYPNVFRPI